MASKEERRRQRDEILQGGHHEPEAVDTIFAVLERPVTDAGDRLSSYQAPDGVLWCRGDENSLCCPFALDRESLKVQVIVEGTLRVAQSMADQSQEYRILVEDICRVPD